MPPSPLEIDDSDESYGVRRKARRICDDSGNEWLEKDSLEFDEATQREFERITRAALQTLKERGRDPVTDLKAKEVMSELRSIIEQIDSSEGPHTPRRPVDEAKEPAGIPAKESDRQEARTREEPIRETDTGRPRMEVISTEAGEESLGARGRQEHSEKIRAERPDERPIRLERRLSMDLQRTEKGGTSDESQVNESGENQRGPRRLRIYEPTIRGHKVGSFEEFNEIVDREFPGVRNNELFNRSTGDVEKHFKLRELVGANSTLEKGDIPALARQIGKTVPVTKEWVEGKQPKDYELLDGAISKSEAADRIQRLIEINGGIKNVEDVRKRLATYFAAPEYLSSPNYQKDQQNAEKYFRFLDVLKNGGLVTEIQRMAGIGPGQVQAWLEGSAPWMIKLASCIPSEEPREGHVWMPLTTGPKNNPSNFIQVPIKIGSYKDVERVIGQLKPLDSQSAVRARERFGQNTMVDSFMYSLGCLLSDAHARKVPDSNLAGSVMTIMLGRVYDWSTNFGEGLCCHLGMLGLKTYREKDASYKPGSSSYPSSGAHVWQTESSPFVTWMRRSCLGLSDGVTKTHSPANADWIVSAPERWRHSFLQGVCDGDGCASLASQYISIATSSNAEFLKRLLNTFGMISHDGDTAVVVSAKDSLMKARDLPLFRYARDRAINLEKLGTMMNTWDNSREISHEQRDLIEDLRAKGVSWGHISEIIYDKYGYSWRHDVIMHRMRRLQTIQRSR